MHRPVRLVSTGGRSYRAETTVAAAADGRESVVDDRVGWPMIGPDAELVARAVRGDPDATAELLTVIRPGVVRYCRAHLGRVGGRYTTADDVSQEVCLAGLRSLPRYRDPGRPFAAFVYGIAAHKIADAQRAAGRHLAGTPGGMIVAQAGRAPR